MTATANNPQIQELKPLELEHVVPAHESFQPSRVICLPIDESKGSQAAIEWTIKNAINKETDQVLLLNVRPYLVEEHAVLPIGFPYTAEQVQAFSEAARKKAHQLLTDSAKQFSSKGIH
ncbi:hypothetical protein HDU91_002812, partial [Kappamyces sp. JEL0680]